MMNKKAIMTMAWELFRSGKGLSFSESLHRAWLTAKAAPINEARIAEAKAMAGITEETDTWYGWKTRGFVVRHGEHNVFGCDLIWGARGDGAVYKARFFTASQVEAVEVA